MSRILRRLAVIAAGAALGAVACLLLVDGLLMPYLVDVPRVRVPRLRGLSVRQAESNLSRWGLRLAIGDSLFHETIPAGEIVDQDPPPGQGVKRGRRITADVSLGPRFYAVPPALVGVSLREARLQLEASRLAVGEITYVSSPNLPAGVVVRATPPAGSSLPRGTPVDLEICSGPPQLPKPVPRLGGLRIEQVEDTLRKYEMRLGPIVNRIDNAQPVGTVLEQSPTGGASAPRLTPISLVVSAQDSARTAAGAPPQRRGQP